MKFKLFLKRFSLIIPFFLIFSCTTYRDYDSVYSQINSGNYDSAYEQLEVEKSYLYTENDEVLYSLDSGLLAHYNKDYKESNIKLSRAEVLIESFYAKSISQGINSFFVNDSMQDYAGEEYEDIYSNIFMALNYIHLNKIEDAFVEIRRFDNKQKALSVKYAEEIAYAKTQIEDLDYNVQFNNSALARYISLLLYRSRNQMDSATVDKRKIEEAFLTQPQLYPFEMPLAVEEEFLIPSNMARLNIISFAGLSPLKIEQSIDTFNYTNEFFYKLSIPEMYKRGTKVASISVQVYDDKNNSYIDLLEKIESIENIAYDTFAEKKAIIYTKAFLRSISKTAVSTTFDVLAENSNDELYGLLGIMSKVWIGVTEFADLRTSQFFPAEAYVGGLTLPEGNYVVEVRYLDNKGNTISKEVFQDVTVSKNKINLLETLCVK